MTLNKPRLCFCSVGLNATILWMGLVILFAACSPRPDQHVQSDTSIAKSKWAYPPARRGEVIDDYNGVRVADPYRWLEQLDSTETRDWVKAEARLTDSYLERIPARQTIKKRLGELLNFEKFGMPFHAAGRYLYSHNSGLEDQNVLYMAEGLAGAAKEILDPNLLSTNGSLAVVGYVLSHNGRFLAYGVSNGGSDWTDWHIRELDTGNDLPDVLRWTKYYRPVFTRDGKGVFYSAFPAPKPGDELSARDIGDAVYYHALGSPGTTDRRVYARADHPDWQFEPHLTSDGRWLVVLAGEGEVGDKGLENIYLMDLRSDNDTVVPVVEGFGAGYFYAGSDSGKIYFQTSLNAPRGRVIAIDPASPEQAQWREIIPGGSDTMDLAFGSTRLVDHQLIVSTLHDAHNEVRIYDLNGRLRRQVTLPGLGTVFGFGGEPEDQETFYSFTDLATPATIFHLDLESGLSKVYRSQKVAFDTSKLEAHQVFYSGKDGTRIPMYLVYLKGLKRDGTNPTLLYGYGGFQICEVPYFDPARLVWLERGGIFAIANIRGGGEYGEEWHQQGIREHKQTGFDDFIAGATWLIEQRYTSSSRLAIEGGSNGGLLVGACLTQRPDLFGAVLAYVGVMDMLRFDQFGQGAGWEGDFGSPRNPADFKALYAYSPYHNVRAGTHYPASLIITGDHDTRVMPAHSFKFAAALQAAQVGDAPILLRVQLSAGHGGGPTTTQMIAERADAYAFLMDRLGLKLN